MDSYNYKEEEAYVPEFKILYRALNDLVKQPEQHTTNHLHGEYNWLDGKGPDMRCVRSNG